MYTTMVLGQIWVCHTLGTKSAWEVLGDTLGSDHLPTVSYINVHLFKERDNDEKLYSQKLTGNHSNLTCVK